MISIFDFKFIAMTTLILALNLTTVEAQSEVTTIPPQPNAEREFFVDYEWQINGCSTEFYTYGGDAESIVIRDGNIIRMYVHISGGFC